MSFRDIKGQDGALAILRESLRKGRVYSNYLFVGPDGVGKVMAAKNFAKAINCLGNEDAEPCDKCLSCTKIDASLHPDVFLIEPEKESFSIGIGLIRTVLNRASLKPYEGKKKVFIIDKAHLMNAEASNAFLKTLEEPPLSAIFILISRSRHDLLSTIVSRSHTVKFSSSPEGIIKNILREKYNLSNDEASIFSSFSSGCIGRAMSLKENNGIVRKNEVIDSFLKGDLSEALTDDLGKSELKESLDFLASFMRDIYIHKAVPNDTKLYNVDRIAEIKKYTKVSTYGKLESIIIKLITLQSYLDFNVNTKVIIEVLSGEAEDAFIY